MTASKKLPVYIISGPTACGKTDLGVALAQAVDGEVVSADSVQVYKGLDIGTAKPTAPQMRGIAHHLLDVAHPAQPFSVHDYVQLAAAAVRDIHARGKPAVVVGGTGFYINALLFGAEFVDVDAALQRSLEQRGRDDPQALHAQLVACDPAAADKIHPHNIRRTARALAFVRHTGQLFSAHNAAQKSRPPRFEHKFFVLDVPRERLWRRIEERTRAMFCAGLVDEVRGLLDRGIFPQTQALEAIGYKQAVAHIMGRIDLDCAISATNIATRQYAKRQVTWFAHSSPPHTKIPLHHTEESPCFMSICESILR